MRTALFRLGFMLAFSGSVIYGAEGPQIVHIPLTCVKPNTSSIVRAKITGATAPRVEISAVGAPPNCHYYVNMQKGRNGEYWAVLPQVAQASTGLVYRITAGSASSGPYTIGASASCAVPTLTGEEKTAAQNLVIGLMNDASPAAPCGFNCNGVVSYITAAGELKPNRDCHALLAAAGAGAGTGTAAGAAAGGAVVAAGAGGGIALATAAGIVLATATALAIHNKNKKKHSPSTP